MDSQTLFVGLVCSTQRQPAVIRFTWNGHSYEAVGVSKQRPGSVIPADGPAGQIRGAFTCTTGFACPHCRADGFVRCGRCQELGCHDGSWEIFNCPRCGNSGPVSGSIDSLSGLGHS